METLLTILGVLIPLAFHVAVVVITYRDAPKVGMDPQKWTVIVLAVPIFGFFAYLFERSERDYDPESDPYNTGTYNIHPSRSDDGE